MTKEQHLQDDVAAGWFTSDPDRELLVSVCMLLLKLGK